MDFKEIKYIKHYLYDSVVEFGIYHPDVLITDDWKLGEEKDWVLTDDGYVCQILKRGKLYEKALDCYNDYIRTVCGTFVVQKANVKMLGENGIAENIYAFSGNFKSKNTYQKLNKLNNKEFLFARYVAEGKDATEAFRMVYPKASKESYIQQRTGSLLNKESIRKMVKEEIKKILSEEGVTPEWIIGKYRDIIDIGDRDSDKLRSLEALSKISGLFDTEKRQEQLTVWQGFSPEQLEAINGGQTKVLAHAEREKEGD
jgi:hypothetical protein